MYSDHSDQRRDDQGESKQGGLQGGYPHVVRYQKQTCLEVVAIKDFKQQKHTAFPHHIIWPLYTVVDQLVLSQRKASNPPLSFQSANGRASSEEPAQESKHAGQCYLCLTFACKVLFGVEHNQRTSMMRPVRINIGNRFAVSIGKEVIPWVSIILQGAHAKHVTCRSAGHE